MEKFCGTFSKEDRLIFRSRKDGGETLYSRITIRDERIIAMIRLISEKENKSPSKIIGAYVEKAFNAGLVLE